MRIVYFLFVFLNFWLISDNRTTNNSIRSKSSILSRILSRQKRFIWYTLAERRFVLPPGTILILTPRLELPFIRQPPTGLNSDISISWVFYLFFDKLGFTSQNHPWPPMYPFGNGNASALNGSVSEPIRGPERRFNQINHNYVKRSVLSLPPQLSGGERAQIFPKIEAILNSIGFDSGRSCLLRITCEIHEIELTKGYGLFGEIVTLLFSISNSQFAESHLPEYLKAEESGKNGDCSEYVKICSRSIFTDNVLNFSK